MGGNSHRARIVAAWRRASAVTMLGLAGVFAVMPAAAAAGAPDLSISVSSSASGALSVGDHYSYAVSVTNHGTAVAHDVSISDDFPVGVQPLGVPPLAGGSCSIASSQHSGGPPHTSVYCTRSALPAGDTIEIDVAVRLTSDVRCGALVNEPRTKAGDEPSGSTGDNTASVTDTVTCPPSIAIVTGAPGFTHVGASIVIMMAVTNDGDVDLGEVRVRNTGCTGSIEQVSDGNGDPTLAPSETWRYRCGRHIPPSVGARLSALGVVTAASDSDHAQASDRATVRVLRPGLMIRVTPGPVSGALGETITYRYLVRNTGGAVLTDIAVEDDHLGHVGDVAQLAPGHSVTFTVDRVLAASDVWVVDEATATGTDRSGRPVTATDTAAVTIVGHTGTDRGPSGGGPSTAFTGSRTVAPALAGCALAMLGAAALLLARRRIA